MNFLKKTFFVIERLTRSKRFWFLIFILFVMLSSAGDEKASDPYAPKKETPTYEYKLVDGKEDSKNRILSIRIDGVIMDQRVPGQNPLLTLGQQETYGAEVKEMLVRASKDKTIKAVLLEINSPGGTVTGAKSISEGIEYFRTQGKKPVYAHIAGEGLSGGYWSAASAEKIFANDSSLVGSIGVILGPFKRYSQVISEGGPGGSIATKDPIETYYMTAGKSKDIGSPYRDVTEDETKHWQNMINESYDMFVNHVSKARNISASTVKDTIKAVPHSTTKAKEYKLIDEVADRDEAISQLVSKAGLKDDYQVIQEKRKYGALSGLLSAVSLISQPKAEVTCNLCGKPLFLYDPANHLVK